ncbi:hypothetical protein [Candidatus Neptunichlamydia sp. REUL1]|uniref:hypothetical protein n=1 Tax=Candidatus Neptunichlamydia sp. REUL1 TaxID=3064277 RepID=UPI00293152D3|nr:hypothetical protein [Candidatus Neptunochlamydia sp. REUL1]
MEAVNLVATFFTASGLRGIRCSENEWHLEKTPLPAAMCQTALVLIALGQLCSYYELQKLKALSTPTYALGIVPLLIGHEAEMNTLGAQKVARAVNRNLGFPLTLSYFVATYAIFKLKKYKHVAASLSGYVFIAIVDLKQTPEKLKESISKVMTMYFPLNDFFFAEELPFKLLGMAKLLTYGEEYYGPDLYGSFEERGLQSGKAFVLKDVVDTNTGVNPGHLMTRVKPWGTSSEIVSENEELRILIQQLRQKEVLASEKVFNEMLSIVQKVFKKPEAREQLASLLNEASGARLMQELPKLYVRHFSDKFTAEEALYTLLYQKQDTFLLAAFEKDYKTSSKWFRRFSFEGTPQLINSYRIFYGGALGFNLDYAKSDATQSSDGAPFSRLIWQRWVTSTSQEFFRDFYTEENLTKWIQVPEFTKIPSVTSWLTEHGIDELNSKAARFFLLKHRVLGFRA